MKKRLNEDEKMMEIIHNNCIKHREFYAKRDKKLRKKRIIFNVLGFVGTIAFMYGIGLFLAAVEHMCF